MKTNVTYSNTEYFVNEAKKTVTCKIQFDINLDMIPNFDVLLGLPKVQKYFENLDVMIMHSDNGLVMKHTVIGKNKCKQNDDFNVEIGKRIAQTKAQANAFAFSERVHRDIYNKVLDSIVNIERIAEGARISKNVTSQHAYILLSSL